MREKDVCKKMAFSAHSHLIVCRNTSFIAHRVTSQGCLCKKLDFSAHSEVTLC